MSGGLGYDTVFGVAYAVAKDSSEAYEMVRQYLVDEQIGFDKDREMKSIELLIELLADEAPYPACSYRLYLPEEPAHE
jgi:hypothetical protein